MMLLPSSVRVFLATDPCDLRKGFDGLSGLVQTRFAREVLDGHLFVFLNRRANQVRILFWDGTGLCYLAKRLERGTFRRAHDAEGRTHAEIHSADLLLLLEGVELRGARRSPRWRASTRAAE